MYQLSLSNIYFHLDQSHPGLRSARCIGLFNNLRHSPVSVSFLLLIPRTHLVEKSGSQFLCQSPLNLFPPAPIQVFVSHVQDLQFIGILF